MCGKFRFCRASLGMKKLTWRANKKLGVKKNSDIISLRNAVEIYKNPD